MLVNDDVSLNEYRKNHQSGVWLVWYYAEWCGHCQMMSDSWDTFTALLKKTNLPINTAKIEDTMISQLGASVDGYPTIELHKNGKLVEVYYDERSPKGFLKFCKKHVKTSKVKKPISKKRTSLKKKKKNRASIKRKARK